MHSQLLIHSSDREYTHSQLLIHSSDREYTHSQLLSLSPLVGAQEDVAAEHKAEASADWSEQEGHLYRVDYKTKEQLDLWDYQVLKNWAYSRKTFVLVSTTIV